MRRGLRAATVGIAMIGLAGAVAAVVPGTAATAAAADVELPLTAFSAIATDPAGGAVFISSASNSAVVRVAGDGTIRTATGVPGASGLAVVGSTLYVALPGDHAIAALDAATLAVRTRYATGPGTCPTHLAAAGAVVWFGYGCGQSFGTAGLGSLSTGGANPAVATGKHGDLSLLGAPLVAARPGGPVVISERGSSGLTLNVFDVDGVTTTHRVTNEPGALGGDTMQFALTPDGSRVVLAAGNPNYVQVLTTAELKLAGVYDAAPYPIAVAVSPDGRRVASTVYDSADGSGLFLFAAGRATPRTRVALTDTPTSRGLAWAPDSSRVYAVTGHYEPPGITLRAIQVTGQTSRSTGSPIVTRRTLR